MEPSAAVMDNSMKLTNFTALAAAVILFLSLLAGAPSNHWIHSRSDEPLNWSPAQCSSAELSQYSKKNARKGNLSLCADSVILR